MGSRSQKRNAPQSVKRQSSGRIWNALSAHSGLESAWHRLRANYPTRTPPPEIAEFESEAAKRIKRLSGELAASAFVPSPAALIEIPKPDQPGETRPLALPRIEDRIVLARLNALLTPLLDHRFPERSFAYRPQRGPAQAVARVSACLGRGLAFAAAADIDDFFASISRQLLMTQIRRYIWEQPVLDLLETYLHMGSVRAAQWVDPGRGIAQGSALSPLLSNLHLLEFDQHLDQQSVEWVRYADNVIVLTADPDGCRQTIERAGAFLQTKLGLKWNEASIESRSLEQGFEFLGYWFDSSGRRMSPARLERKRKEIEARIRSHRGSLPSLVRSLSESARGWRNYYRGDLVRPQLERLEDILAAETAAWIRTARAANRLRGTLKDLRRELQQIELPASHDQKALSRWVNRVITRSRLPVPARSRPSPPPIGPQSPSARAAVELRKRELARRRAEMEELLITQPGVSLHRNGERLVVRREGKRQAEIPLALIRGVTLLTTAVSISAEFMAEAAARGIRLSIHGTDGRPMVRSGPPDLPDFAISELQIRLSSSPDCHLLARQFVAGKIRNQINLLKYLNKHKTRRNAAAAGEAVLQALETMEPLFRAARDFAPRPDGPLARQSLFALEGQAALAYWKTLRLFLPARAGFEGRVRRGATDLVNSLLNYAYAILYGRLQEILLKQGLNPAIGFLHAPREGKQPLLYDFIEEFRPSAADRVVLSLLNLGKPYGLDEQGLPPAVRYELARHVIKRWRTEERYNGAKYTLEQIAAEQARRLIRHLRGEESYRPYVLSW